MSVFLNELDQKRFLCFPCSFYEALFFKFLFLPECGEKLGFFSQSQHFLGFFRILHNGLTRFWLAYRSCFSDGLIFKKIFQIFETRTCELRSTHRCPSGCRRCGRCASNPTSSWARRPPSFQSPPAPPTGSSARRTWKRKVSISFFLNRFNRVGRLIVGGFVCFFLRPDELPYSFFAGFLGSTQTTLQCGATDDVGPAVASFL